MEDGSDWDAQLDEAAGCLAELGIDSAPALRWHGNIYTGLDAISALLADNETHPPSLSCRRQGTSTTARPLSSARA